MTEKDKIMKQLLENTQEQIGAVSAKPILLPRIKHTPSHTFDILGTQDMTAGASGARLGDSRATANTEIASKISDIMDLVKKQKEDKQQELLDDAIIIHRIGRSPERTVFHVDTGGLPDEEALKKIDELKDAMIKKCAETRTKKND